MKAIIFVSPESAYGAQNGKTFNVLDFYGPSTVTLMLPGRGVDFLYHEIAIVDIDAELEIALQNKKTSAHLSKLLGYCKATGISVDPKYLQV